MNVVVLHRQSSIPDNSAEKFQMSVFQMGFRLIPLKLMRKVLEQLIGEKLDIEDLKTGLLSRVWTIAFEKEGYYLSSKILDGLFNNREIVLKACEFIDIMNGAANILYSNHKNVEVGNLTIVGPNGSNHVLIAETGHFKLRSRVREHLSVKNNDTSQPIIETWLNKSNVNSNVKDALHFFSEVTWWNLYKIYEIINEDIGGQRRLYKLIDKDQIKLFTQAAQSRELLGDNARHASKKYAPPKVKLTLEQACHIIVVLFKKWVDSK